MTGTIGSTASTILEACERVVAADALVWVRGLDSQRDPLALFKALDYFRIGSASQELPLVRRQEWPALRKHLCDGYDEFWIVPANTDPSVLRAVPEQALTTDGGFIRADPAHAEAIERAAASCKAFAAFGDGDGYVNYFAADARIEACIRACDEESAYG